ncbi:hypothetical protein [Actinomyces polynesiensis]|uniref:hypothetical protein n=1 Tax=Actinomyces polynesiensis TaxID=1325934 RepID=UPI0005BE664E|nr:hypothetical protein [Actinomyces polynesiensis]
MTITPSLRMGGGTVSMTADQYPTDDTALDSLRIIWGRGDPWSHPDPATLTARVALVTGVPGWLHVGATIDAHLGGTIEDDRPLLDLLPWVDAADLPDLWSPQVFPPQPRGDSGLPEIERSGVSGGWVEVYPGPRVPTEFPRVWDNRRRAYPGDTLTLTLDMPVHRGYTVEVAPILFLTPSATYRTLPTQVTILPSETTGPTTATITIPTDLPSPGPYWVGLRVSWEATEGYKTWADDPGTWASATGTWEDHAARLHLTDIALTAPPRDTSLDTTSFSGSVTEVVAAWDDKLHRPVATITATDILADINATRVGETPWPAEPTIDRLTRILTTALGQTPTVLDAGALLPSRTCRARDVDSRSAGDLARLTLNTNLATLHPTYQEDTPTFRLVPMGAPSAQDVAVRIPASSIPRDGLRASNSTGTGATVVEVTWRDGTTDRTWTDELPDLGDLGPRSIKIETEAASESQALDIGWQALHLMDPRSWQITGLTLSTVTQPTVSDATLLALLDPTSRPGQRLTITDCPPWVGGPTLDLLTLGASMTAHQGGWTLDLDVLRITH